MKIFRYLFFISFFLQTTLVLACPSHIKSNANTGSKTHCHETNQHNHENEDEQKSSSDCPICELGLCIQSEIFYAQALIQSTKTPEPLKLLISSSNTNIFKVTNYYVKSLNINSSELSLPQNKNWQAFYSVFRN